MKLTVIVPTYNEGENVSVLASAIMVEMKKAGVADFEILFVDDSTDETPVILERLSRDNPKIRSLHREKERGLGTAIVAGFRGATGEILAVMDGDLQHPPSLLPTMLAFVFRGYDLVLPSRFIPGGSDGGLTLPRKLVSLTARYMGRVLLGRVRKISDPTGGFFMFRREVISGIDFDARSWKILIEILVRGHYGRVAELPYRFHARELGASKMSVSAQIDYVRHLIALLFLRESPSPDPGWTASRGRTTVIDRVRL
jgi:dolichol-phosphate mannosyltransferase